MRILQEQKSASAMEGVNGDFAGAKIRLTLRCRIFDL